MSYSEYPTKLSLDRFFQIAGIHPLHGNQLRTPSAFSDRRAVGCDGVIYQHRWQSTSGIPGRNDIARAIWEAERDLEEYLHFPLTRTWLTNEPLTLSLPHLHPAHAVRSPFYGYPLATALRRYTHVAKLHNAHVLGAGVRATALIESGVAVTRSDADVDGFEELVTIGPVTLDSDTVAAVVDAEEFRLFYPDKGPDPLWEIRPVRVLYEPLADPDPQVTLTFDISQLVDPDLYEHMVPEAIDPDGVDVFLTAVDIYRVYTDTTITACYSARCGTSFVSTAGSAVGIEDPEGGVIRVYRNLVSCSCSRPVETLSYVAGYPRSTYTQMDHAFERAVVALALSRLGGICSCKSIPSYNRDLSVITQASSSQGSSELTRWALRPPEVVMKNPFGTSEGAHVAWTTIVTQIAGETANDYL